MIVEMISPSTRPIDRVKKMALYAEHGVFRSKAVSGSWLKVEWLFAAQPLDIVDTVMEILAHEAGAKKKRARKR